VILPSSSSTSSSSSSSSCSSSPLFTSRNEVTRMERGRLAGFCLTIYCLLHVSCRVRMMNAWTLEKCQCLVNAQDPWILPRVRGKSIEVSPTNLSTVAAQRSPQQYHNNLCLRVERSIAFSIVLLTDLTILMLMRSRIERTILAFL
jgi:hypothetical protein